MDELMQSSALARRGGLAALVGATIGILYAPLYALAYFATADGAESLAEEPPIMAWHEAARPVLEPLLTFASPDTVYLMYGKASLFMILGWLAGTLAQHARQAAHAGKLEQWGFRIVLCAMSLMTIGSVGAYYVGSVVAGAVDFSFLAFLVPGMLVMLIGWPLLGIATLRAGVAPRWGAWLLIVGFFPGMIVLSFIFG